MKVYELAKKLEVKSVFLMDKIRKEWKLPVKTHMEALSPEMIEKIKENFYSSQKTAEQKSAKKKKILKKATAKKATAKKLKTKKAGAKKISSVRKTASVKKKSTIKKQSVSKTAPGDSPLSEEPSEKQNIQTQLKRTIIIRRKVEEKKAPEIPSPSSTSTSSSPEKKESSSPVSPSAPSKSFRLDLVSVKTSRDPLDKSFWDKDKKEEPEEKPIKKQPKKPIAEKDVSSKFNATDFRKREVIFQPRKKRIAQAGEIKNTQITTPKSHKRIIKIYEEMSIRDLCKKMGLKKQALLKKLKEEEMDIKKLSTLDFDTIALIVPAFGFEAKNIKQTEKDILDKLENNKVQKGKEAQFAPKPPVVTIMGHVDHGKTTLLDAIRKTKVAEAEAGGITQHIGAYSVPLEGKTITFLDTPGHEAFTAMRSRGAQVTDIVVILVSASDGMMPQTLEALNHAKAAKIPIIIAISKMDAPGANPDKIKQQMSDHEIVPEDWGGDTSFIPISAIKGEGIKELLEQIQLVAEMQELKCQPFALAKGVVLEARREKGLGCIVNLLIRDGTLKSGESVVTGECMGKIRQMTNDQGKIIKEAQSGFPVEAIGFHNLPQAGDTFCVVTNEKAAKDLLALRKDKNQSSKKKTPLSPEELLLKMELSGKEKQDLNIVLKTDVRGSLEALKNSLEKIKSDEVSVKIIHSGVGAITESDILLADAISGIVFGFNVRPDGKALKIAKAKTVDIYTHSIIYELLDQVKKLMLGLLKVEFMEEEQGRAEIREVFHISKVGSVAGSYVTSGQIFRNSLIRLVRDGRLIHEGPLSSLRRFKENVKQVGEGFECGISLENFNDIKPKDILEAYTKKEKVRTEL